MRRIQDERRTTWNSLFIARVLSKLYLCFEATRLEGHLYGKKVCVIQIILLVLNIVVLSFLHISDRFYFNDILAQILRVTATHYNCLHELTFQCRSCVNIIEC